MSKVTYYISAYALAVKHGFQGTEEEWVNSLQGRDGRDGAVSWDQLSPEQRAELVGPPGPQGPKGDTGSDAEVNEDNILRALGYVPAEKEAVRTAAPENLLDNSWFVRPVNLHGQTRYTKAGYTINRWYSKNTFPVETVAGGIMVTESIHQYVRDARKNVRYTLAAEDTGGSIYIITEKPEDNVFHTDLEIGWTAAMGVSVRISNRTYRWAALYEGEYTAETLPVYRPKGYGAEVNACKQVGDDGDGTAETLDWLNVTVQPGSFTEDSTYEDFPYKARIQLEGALQKMAPEVVFPVAEEMYAPVCESYDGGVMIWVDDPPAEAVVIPRITMRRVNGT